jgi:hypothetical protein
VVDVTDYSVIIMWGLSVLVMDYLIYRLGLERGLNIVVKVSKLALVIAAFATLTLLIRTLTP